MSSFRANVVALLAFPPLLVASTRGLAAPNFAAGIQTGTIQNILVNEASGIAASRKNSNVLWTHNDSGDSARVFAMTPAGTDLGTYSIADAGATDWEDIAVGPGPTAGAQYLYIGDIGDNGASRGSISIYRVPEPVVSDMPSPDTTTLSGAVQFTFTYPGGPRDAESLFVDPLTKDIYIISKRENPHHLYRSTYSQYTTGNTLLEEVASYSDTNWLTAADISPGGYEIIVRGDGSGAADNTGRMFIRPPGGSIADALESTPIMIPLISDGQGEAIGFDPNGWGYFTTSEGSNRAIHYFNRLPPPAGTMYWDNDGTTAGTYVATGAGMGSTGTWNSSTLKWYNGSANVAWVNGNNAVFWGSTGTVTLSAPQSVNGLTFKTTGYTISGSTLTLGGSSVTVDAGITATISSVVAGSAGLVKNGAGKLVLTNSSNQTSGYTGGTTINAGTLTISSGTISHSGEPVTINNGATLQFTGNFTLAAARSVTLGTGGGTIDTNGNTDTIAGVISGTSINKIGAGTLTLTGANAYSSATTVSNGTLLVNNGTGSGTGTGAVVVQSGAVLGGTGAISGGVTVSDGAHLAPGANIESLDVGSLTLAEGSILDFEFDTVAGVDKSDLVNVTVTSGLTINGGTLNVTNAASMTTGTYMLIDYEGTLIGSLSNLTLGSTPSDFSYLLVNNTSHKSIDLLVTPRGDFDHNGTVSADDYVTWRKGVGTTYTLTDYNTWRAHFGQTNAASAPVSSLALVPEPATWCLLTVVASLFFIRRHSR